MNNRQTISSYELNQIDDVKIIGLKNSIKTELLKTADKALLEQYDSAQSLHSLAFLKSLLKNPENQFHEVRDKQMVIYLINKLMLSIINNGVKL